MVALNELVPDVRCTPAVPCGDLLGAVFAALWLTVLYGVFAAPPVAAACAAAAAAWAVGHPATPLAFRAAAVAGGAYVVAVVVHRHRRLAALRGYLASVAGARQPPRRDPAFGRRARAAAGIAVLAAAATVAAGVIAYRVVSRERAAERAADVAAAVVVRHDGDDVVFQVGDYESAFEAFEPADYPLGAEVPVYVLPGGARPLAEPYDASYAAFPALVLAGLAVVLGYRAAAHRPPPAVPVLAVRAVPHADGTLLAPVPEGDPLLLLDEPVEEERALVATGDLVPGGWVELSDGDEPVVAGWAARPGRIGAAARRSLRR
jgi:hypothetical protein